MRIAARRYRQIVVTVMVLSAGGCVAAPAAFASAGTAGGKPAAALAIAGPSATAAAAQPAPVVTDAQPAASSKRDLPAPPMTAAMRWANASRQTTTRALLQLRAASMSPDAKCASLACRAGLPSARNLAATQEPQARNYFCGPATVSEMLAQLGVKLGQFAAARELRTTANGTDWSDAAGYPVPKVLNGNQTRNRYVAVALPWTPTAKQVATYETDLVADITDKGGVPLAGNAYEVAGGPHLVGNPVDQTIMHWFDIRGYQKYGAITDYEDSVHDASSIGWALDVPAYSSMPSGTIADILGARGYDW
jgi:hypothetical protein